MMQFLVNDRAPRGNNANTTGKYTIEPTIRQKPNGLQNIPDNDGFEDVKLKIMLSVTYHCKIRVGWLASNWPLAPAKVTAELLPMTWRLVKVSSMKHEIGKSPEQPP